MVLAKYPLHVLYVAANTPTLLSSQYDNAPKLLYNYKHHVVTGFIHYR